MSNLKLPYKIYLSEDELHRIREKLKNYGYSGNGSIGRFLRDKFLSSEIIFLDPNTKTLLKALNLKVSNKKGFPILSVLLRPIGRFIYSIYLVYL